VKRQATEWENVFANCVSDKGLVSRIYKDLSQLNSQMTNDPIEKWAKDLNRHVCKKHMIRCSASLVIREIQTKSTGRYHFTHTSTAIKKERKERKKKKTHQCRRGCGDT